MGDAILGNPGRLRATGAQPARNAGPKPAEVRRRSAGPRRERFWVALLLTLHAALAGWVMTRNSVTFDENFHLPAGLLYLERANTQVSLAQPPLARALFALPAAALGARLPPDSLAGYNEERLAGYAFMRANADRYQVIYGAARSVGLMLSLGVGLCVWWFARSLYGGPSGLFALALWAVSPEALAHAGIVGMDVATALVFLWVVLAARRYFDTSRWRDWTWLALAIGTAALTRFTAVSFALILPLLAGIRQVRGRLPRPRVVWFGIALLAPAALVALQIGYLGHTSWRPLAERTLYSQAFHGWQAALPRVIVPLPDGYLGGLDYLSFLTEGARSSFLLGQVRTQESWTYLPLALLWKWPLGLLGLVIVRGAHAALGRRRWPGESFVLLPALTVIAGAMVSRFNFGVRYLLPALPFVCVWCSAMVSSPPARATASRPSPWARVAIVLLLIASVESVAALPWPLAFFNVLAGGPGRGDRLVNDSNVDWGQGLIALREELRARGIGKVHLAYHGTTDPALYGIDYLPYLGGVPGPESDWLAVSSYYFVGLSARMVSTHGITHDVVTLDFRPLWNVPPVARPARCMYLFRVRQP